MLKHAQLPNGTNLGPYRLVRLLGHGGMGSVYLAKQTSLDRDVALKVISTQLSNSPQALARFTREAYAAAQLVHPNVVQVYDMGDAQGYCYFSMEYVNGKSLAEILAQQKQLTPEQAASFILQAARGLAHAHAAGMVHRDIKPGNLLVAASGALKVADLGLVKVPGQDEIGETAEFTEGSALSASEDLTRSGSALGTSYYMAPEQAKNALAVDHRADIYSLGCTFYVLLTGKKPFDGKTFEEVVSKHFSAPLILPSQLVEQVPTALSRIVLKMMAKNPGDRYQSLDELIPELESYLGIATTANFVPDPEALELLRSQAGEFNQAGLAPFRSLFPIALVGACLVLAFLMSFLSWRWASGLIVLPIFTMVAFVFVSGFRENGAMFLKARELILERAFAQGMIRWLKWLLAGIVLLTAVYLLGLLTPWLMAALAGIGLAVSHYVFVDRRIAEVRRQPLLEIEKLLKARRASGWDEKSSASFVAQYSGRDWEELFEHLFGYDAKRQMREELAKSAMAKPRPKFWAWRDPLYDAWSKQLKQLKSRRDRQHLEDVEFAGLQAAGLPPAEARERASQMAGALVDQAAEQKIAALEKRIADLDPHRRSEQKRQKVKQLLADARSGKYRKEKSRWQQIEPQLNRYLGRYTRFLAGCLLITGSLFWAKQNGILAAVQDSAARVQQGMQPTEQHHDLEPEPAAVPPDAVTPDAVPDKTNGADKMEPRPTVDSTLKTAVLETLNRETRPLQLPLLGRFFDSFNALVAGLILVASALIFGWRMTLFAVPAAVVAMFGSMFLKDIENLATIHSLSCLIALGIFMAGIVFGRAED